MLFDGKRYAGSPLLGFRLCWHDRISLFVDLARVTLRLLDRCAQKAILRVINHSFPVRCQTVK